MKNKNLIPYKGLIAIILLILSCSSSWAADDLLLLKDINTNTRGLKIIKKCVAPSFTLLVADDGFRGYEFWVGDGVSENARLLKDINVGANDGLFRSPECLTIGNTIIFPANSQSTGVELWKTDGTPSGTVLVKDISSGATSSEPSLIATDGSKVYFSARTTTAGRELWKSDGTGSGTTMVQDFTSGAGDTSISEGATLNSSLIYDCDSPTLGREVCIYNGSTIQVVDLATGSDNSYPQTFFSFANKIFFSADTPALGRELYSSDGTTSGTTIFKDIQVGIGSGIPSSVEFVSLNNKLFFVADSGATGFELWSSNGTASGTSLLKDIYSGLTTSNPQQFKLAGNKFVFIADTAAQGKEVWVSNGTSGGTNILADVIPGSVGSAENTYELNVQNNKVVALLATPNDGREVIGIDLTTGGSETLTNFIPGDFDLAPYPIGEVMDNDVQIYPPNATSSIASDILFLSDGTTTNTRIHPGSLPSMTASSTPTLFGEANGRLIFAANDGESGYELWSSDGTSGGTSRILDANSGVTWSVIPQHGSAIINNGLTDLVLFVGIDATNGAELWVTDGTAGGTSLLKDLEPGAASSFTRYSALNEKSLFSNGTKAFIVAETSAYGREVWVSDGTALGTFVHDINVGTFDAFSDFEGAVSGSLFFFAADNTTNGQELWYSNGTTATLAADIDVGAGSSQPAHITANRFNPGMVVFSAYTGATGREPYDYSQGTGLIFLSDLNPGAGGSDPKNFTIVKRIIENNQYLFSANLPATGDELYRIDYGTLANELLVDAVPGPGGSNLDNLYPLDDYTVLFSNCNIDGAYNCELWKSDSTVAGTTLVTDLNPSGNDSTNPEFLGTFNGNVYFSGYNNSENRYQLFRTNGTEAGTASLTFQGATNSSSDLYRIPGVNALSKLFLPTYSGIYGTELFYIGEDLCPSNSNKSFPGVCGCGTADADTDGDGTLNCQDSCPSDSTKTSPGGCGCGIADTDLNSNSRLDCVDREISSLTPTKPKVRLKRGNVNKVKVKVQNIAGARYVVRYRYGNTGRFRAKTFRNVNKIFLNSPALGQVIQVKYKIKMIIPGEAEILSRSSRIRKFTRR